MTRLASKPLFITGAPRCGSSWVGEIIGSANGVRYVYEPFNLKWAPQLEGKLSYFTYLRAGDEGLPAICDAADAAFSGRQNIKQLWRAAYRGYLRSCRGAYNHVVVKDPTAPLISEWLADRVDAQPLIIVRHPCGFASSAHLLNWRFDTNYFLRQKLLMASYLGEYETILRKASSDPWKHLAAVWCAIHKVLAAQAQNHPDWLFCIYEDLCSDPVEHFSALFGHMGIAVDDQLLSRIQKHSTKHSNDSGSTKKQSSAMGEVWRQRLSNEQISTIMGVCSEFGLAEYPGQFLTLSQRRNSAHEYSNKQLLKTPGGDKN